MYNILKFFVLVLTFSLLNSCAHFKISELDKNINKDDKSFYSLLSKEYNNFAKYELYNMHDEIDANYFAYKGLEVLNKKKVYVESPDNWKLTKENNIIFNKEFKNISKILKEELYLKYPKKFALMIAGYDCWIEQSEENWQLEDIEKCKNKYYNNFKEIITNNENDKNRHLNNLNKDKADDQMIEDHVTIKATDNIKVIKKRDLKNQLFNVNVFFAFDSYILNNKQQKKLIDFIYILKKQKLGTVYIYGHTDRKGSENYNMKLSLKRANHVKELMQRNNIKNNMVIKAFGESSPLINTFDEIEEQKNRRTEIIIK